MMGSKSAGYYLVALLVLVNLVSFVVSKCCYHGTLLFSTECSDGSTGEVCCGRGACNVFCCNCDDGCRGERKRGADHHGGETEKELFAKMDVNRDGFVDKAEADAYALKKLNYNGTAQLVSFNEGFKKLGKAKITLADLLR